MSWQLLVGTRLGDPLGDRFNDIVAVGQRRWAIAKSGLVARWTPGGWTTISNLTGHLRSLGFEPSGQVGWMGMLRDPGNTTDPRLRKTVDGGITWQDVDPQIADPVRGICGISVLDANTAFACGTFDQTSTVGVWRTIDGTSWTSLVLPGDVKNLVGIHFWSADCGFVVGGQGNPSPTPAILLTRDGGLTWTTANVAAGAPAKSYCWKIFFVDGVTGYASLANTVATPMILKTVDAGRNWSLLQLNLPGVGPWDIQGIAFIDSKHGWVGQEGGALFETTDGGTTWAISDALPTDVNRIRVLAGEVLACGDAVYRLPL